MTEAALEKTKPRWYWRVLRAFGVFFGALGLCILAGIWWLTDRPVSAPDWLRERIEARLTDNLPNVDARFGDMVVTVHQGWRPKVQVRDVTFTGTGGREILALSELQASLAMEPLLNQQVQPKTIELFGIFATLRIDEDGRVTLRASSKATAAEREAATFADLVEQVDRVFLRPELSSLSEMNVGGVTLRVEDARSRRAWTIDGARMRLNRSGNDLRISADLAVLGGGAGVSTLEANYASRIGQADADFGLNVIDLDAADLAAISPAFGWLEVLRAPISGAVRGGIALDGALEPINATLQIGQGVLQPTDQTRPIPFTSARTYFTFDPRVEQLEFSEIAIDSDWGRLLADGRADLTGLGSGQLQSLVGQFDLSTVEIDPPEMFPAPVTFPSASIDFRLTPEPFRFDLGQLLVSDQTGTMRFDGALTAAPEGWHFDVNGRMAETTRARMMDLWPPGFVTHTRSWLETNLLAADLSNVDFAMRARPDTRADVFLSFDFADTQLQYVTGMSPIMGARGVGTLLRDRFVLAVEDGYVRPDQGGEIDVAGSAFIVPDVTVKDGAPAVVRLRTTSSVTAALALLDQEPLSILKNTNLPVELAEGQAELNTTLSLPLRRGLKNGEIRYDVDGTLRGVGSDKIVQSRRIEADALRLVASNDRLEIGGAGQFDGVPFDGVWSQALGPDSNGASEVRAQIAVSQATSDGLNIGLPPGSLQGSARGDLRVRLAKDAPPRFDLASNLRGVRLSIPALGWAKSPGSTGRLQVSGSLGDRPALDDLLLEAPGLTAQGRVSVTSAGGLEQANFSRVSVGNWFDGPADLIGRGTGAPVGVRVRGGSLDLRAAEFGSGSGGGSGSSGPITLELNRLQITDSIALTDMQGEFGTRGGFQGRFTGKVNGATPVRGQVEPSGGRSAIKIESGNAGGVFAAAGLLKQARGGNMSLVLQPVGTAGAFNGSLRIRDTRVKDAPAIAALFNALSVVGLLEQMSGQGLHFEEVEAAFRLTPEKVTLTQASAVGPSIGLSMDGTYDVNSTVMNMRGVFSPIYLINGLGSVLTRKGEGLIGFNFRLAGPASGPKVQVNPLSGLTPGFFREIFRRPPPDVAVEPGEQPGSAPKKLAPERQLRKETLVPRGGDR